MASPFSWPARLAQEITKYPNLVDPEFYSSALGYRKHLDPLIQEGMTSAGAAKLLHQRGYRLHGWSKSIIQRAFYPAAGGAKKMPPIPPSFSPQDISSWNREALLSRLQTSVARGPVEPVPLPHFYKTIASRASRFGLGQELLSRIGPSAPQLLSDAISPPSFATRASRFGKSAIGQIRGLSTPYKIGIGAAVGLLGLYSLQPGSWFSGRGKSTPNLYQYHRFDLNEDKTISPLEKRFGKFTTALSKYGVETGTGHKRIYIPKDIISEEDLGQLGFSGVKIAIPEAGQSRFESFRHERALYHLHEHGDVWTLHEDEHPAATMAVKQWARQRAAGLGGGIPDLGEKLYAGAKHTITEGVPGAYYYLKGQLSETDDMLARIRQDVSPQYQKFISRTRKSLGLPVLSGKDDIHNTIEGLGHRGLAAKKRRELTDFGSGYQGDDNSRSILFPTLAGGAGAGLGYLAAYPWAYSKIDASKYPRLAAMRAVGRKHGFKMVSSAMPSFINDPLLSPKSKSALGIAQETYGKLLWGEMGPSIRLGVVSSFPGVLYIQSGEYSQRPTIPKVANWGRWEIGRDKLTTWQFLKNKGSSSLHAESLAGEEFYTAERQLSESGRAFVEKMGGLENIVLKKREAARGTGVWLSAAELPGAVREDFLYHPEKYLLQEKLNLAEEFRVVTVGDKPVHTTYRFGSPRVRKLAKWLGFTPTKEAIEKTAKVSPFEIIQPVFDRDVKGRLEEFASKVSRELPYEIGALDIGMTKEGSFKLIEAQRSFGNISNPLVSRRIRNLITGKPGSVGIAAAAIGAGVGLWAYGIVSGKDDTYNTIEGLRHGGQAEKKRKELTDFGSGWRGLLSLPKILQPLVSQRGMSMTRERLATFLGSKVSTAAEKKALSEFLFSAGRSPFEEIAVINPLAIRQAAQKRGIAYSKVLKGTISHERFHQRMRQFGLREEITLEVPSTFANKYTGKGLSKEGIVEEYLAHAIEARWVSPANTEAAAARSYIKQQLIPAMNMGNTLEAFGEMGMSSISRKGYGFGSGSIRGFFKSITEAIFGTRRASGWVISAEELRGIGVLSRDITKSNIGFYKKLKDVGAISKKQFRETVSAIKNPPPREQVADFGYEDVRRSLISSGVGLEEVKGYSIAQEWGRTQGGISGEWIRGKKGVRFGSGRTPEKIQARQELHETAQIKMWSNATRAGRKHVSTSTISI